MTDAEKLIETPTSDFEHFFSSPKKDLESFWEGFRKDLERKLYDINELNRKYLFNRYLFVIWFTLLWVIGWLFDILGNKWVRQEEWGSIMY